MRRPAMHDALPLGQWVSQFLNFVLAHDNGTLENLGKVIGAFTEAIEAVLVALPDWAVAGAISAIGLWRVGWQFGLFCAASFFVLIANGFCPALMRTLGVTTRSAVLSL